MPHSAIAGVLNLSLLHYYNYRLARPETAKCPHVQLVKILSGCRHCYPEAGLNHLWIDSLCIIQDSKDDWATESSKMQQYYQGAFITILALSAAGSHEGFLKPRTQKQTVKLDQENIYLRAQGTDWYTIMDGSRLAKRAWILQEQLSLRR